MQGLSALIKQEAQALGFDACGICKAEFTGDHAAYLKDWLSARKHAGMKYMENYFEKRSDPALLLDDTPARSVVVLALNYYPQVKRDPSYPVFSYYAYGKDYHDVMKARLRRLLDFIAGTYRPVSEDDAVPFRGRAFCDTAPLLEKYHAQKAGLGWIGKNTLLIIPNKGSYFFLGILLVNIELEYDAPMENRCGRCRRCLDACPTCALEAPFRLDAGKCISYLTIENREEIPEELAGKMGNIVYGCDICAEACPWNRFARPHHTPEFNPSEAFLSLDREALEQLQEEDFKVVFKHSPVKRAGYKGLMRNLGAIKKFNQ